MDKAEQVFQKHAGVWSKITKVFKKTTKMPGYQGPKKIVTPQLKKLERKVGKITSPRKQELVETHVNKTTWTGGKRPVTILNKEELARNVVRDRYLKNMGL